MNLDKLTYHKKNQLLLAGGLMALVLIYFVAIQPTIDLSSKNQNLENQLQLAQTAPSEIKMLESRSKSWESGFGSGVSAPSKTSNHLIEEASKFCESNNLLLKNYPGATSESHKDFSIETNLLKVEGTYKGILKLAYYLEFQERLGRIASLKFEAVENRRTRKTSLEAEIFLQNIKKTGHEI